MNVEIITTSLSLDIYGFSGVAFNRDYVGKIFKLSGQMWDTVKSKKIENKGMNIWVYEQEHRVFAGVELIGTPDPDTGLEQKNLVLPKYAYYKHIGPYQLIKQAGQNMRDEVTRKGFEITLPHIEIYGHWTNDESKLETELLMSLK